MPTGDLTSHKYYVPIVVFISALISTSIAAFSAAGFFYQTQSKLMERINAIDTQEQLTAQNVARIDLDQKQTSQRLDNHIQASMSKK